MVFIFILPPPPGTEFPGGGGVRQVYQAKNEQQLPSQVA